MGNTAELHGRPAGWRLLQLRAGQQVGRPQQRGVGRQPWEQQVGPLEAAAGQGWAEGRAGVQANLTSRPHRSWPSLLLSVTPLWTLPALCSRSCT